MIESLRNIFIQRLNRTVISTVLEGRPEAKAVSLATPVLQKGKLHCCSTYIAVLDHRCLNNDKLGKGIIHLIVEKKIFIIVGNII